jgi:HK97 family phage prohead protease
MTDGLNPADRINQALQALDDSLNQDAESEVKKDQIRRDVFTTEEEAQERAEQIGCSGTHSHDEDGDEVFMPCATHDEYIEQTGRDVASKEDEEELDSEHIDFRSSIKAYSDEDDEEKGTFEGYGSIFNNKDLGNDVVVNGAFQKSLRRTGPKGVKLLYQHKSDMPIGVFESIKEDQDGLKVKGRLALGTQAGREAYELMKMGALDGLSIGFRVAPKGQEYDSRRKRRYIKEVELMEISLVTFPMNPKARVRSVKGDELSIREWEGGLRDAFSLSRSEAKVAAKAVHKAFNQREAEEADTGAVDALHSLTNTLKHL